MIAVGSFGDVLVSIRKPRKITQERLAELSGVPRDTIAGLESEKAKEPRWETAVAIARALGVSLDQFVLDAAVATPPALDRLGSAEATIAQLQQDLLIAGQTARDALALAQRLEAAPTSRRRKQAAL